MTKLISLVLLFSTPLGLAEIVKRDVSYPAGRVTAHGFLAAPGDGQKHPGVLVVHEMWGQNAEMRKRARMLAELGYTALAVDMFGEGKTSIDLPTAAGNATIASANMTELKARFRAAMKFLRAQEECASGPVAAIGFGFGGNVVLQMARNGQRDLCGVASFHAALKLRPPNPPAKVSARVLVCHGAEDPLVKPEQVEAFKKDMIDAEAELEFVTYPDAFYGFTNPKSTAVGERYSVSFQYNSGADNASWKKLETFLAELFLPDETETGK